MLNKYVKVAHISERKFRTLVRCCDEDLGATQTANLTGLNRNTVNRHFKLIRQRLVELCKEDSPFQGEIEMDESYFGPRRIRGKRGRGAGGKTIVFGLLKRNGKVYTQIVPNARRATLQAIIRGKVNLESVLYIQRWMDRL